jgi:hypothetical protein
MANANQNALTISTETTYRLTPAQLAAIQSAELIAHVRSYNHDDKELRCRVLNGSISSAAANSGATSSIRTKTDSRYFISTGKKSDKTLRMPNGGLESALDIRSPARDIHITPGINKISLISTVKFAKAGYITIFDRDEVNIYDQCDSVITVSRSAILRGWHGPGTNNLWRIPLILSSVTTTPTPSSPSNPPASISQIAQHRPKPFTMSTN